jgi:phosphate transport system substrate-binding protein
MRALLTDIKGADRLTYTFRFRTGVDSLDPKSKQEAEKLAALMLNGNLKGKSIKLIGFADSGGSFENNQVLSVSRARAVQSALIAASERQLAAERLVVKGYGELAPVACNDSDTGRAFNRRVEVWVDREQ